MHDCDDELPRRNRSVAASRVTSRLSSRPWIPRSSFAIPALARRFPGRKSRSAISGGPELTAGEDASAAILQRTATIIALRSYPARARVLVRLSALEVDPVEILLGEGVTWQGRTGVTGWSS